MLIYALKGTKNTMKIKTKLEPAPTKAAKLLAAMAKLAREYPGLFLLMERKTFKLLGINPKLKRFFEPGEEMKSLREYQKTLPGSVSTIIFGSTPDGQLLAGNFG